jgi:hypothetical protein
MNLVISSEWASKISHFELLQWQVKVLMAGTMFGARVEYFWHVVLHPFRLTCIMSLWISERVVPAVNDLSKIMLDAGHLCVPYWHLFCFHVQLDLKFCSALYSPR